MSPVRVVRSLLRWSRSCLPLSLLVSCSRAEPPSPLTRVPQGVSLAHGFDWNGVIGTGQSLAVGVGGTPLRATTPSYRNLKLDLGWRFLAASEPDDSRLVVAPLREPVRWFGNGYPNPYPSNIRGETPHTAMASQITAQFLAESGGAGDYVTVHSVVGESGQNLRTIGKHPPAAPDTGTAYQASLFEARVLARLAKAAKRTFGVSAIVLTHGEADAVNESYESELYEFWRSYNADLSPITGQKSSIPLLVTQQSSGPEAAAQLPLSALAVWRLSRAHPRDIVCVGPRYQYAYGDDGVHLTALGYDRLGEKYGQAYFQHVVQGREFRPLEPTTLSRQGSLIRVDFRVPVPPLRWDESLPGPHRDEPAWARGRGFELWSGDEKMTIEAVTLEATHIELRFSGVARAPLVLRYAITPSPKPRDNGTHRWGQLTDSDPFVGSTTKTAQSNYAVAFELTVP